MSHKNSHDPKRTQPVTRSRILLRERYDGFPAYPDEGSPYLVTTNVKDRRPLFAEHGCCQVVIGGISFLRARLGHRIHAYVLMPDHVHLVVTPREGNDVSQVMHSLKLYTARQIGALLGSKGWIGRQARGLPLVFLSGLYPGGTSVIRYRPVGLVSAGRAG